MKKYLFLFFVCALLISPVEAKGKEEMELGTILVKVANNLRLTEEEKQFLKMEGDNTQRRNTFISGNTSADGKLSLKLPIEIIYSEVLVADVASISVLIPSEFKHLWVIGGGRSTEAGTSSSYLRFTLSGDADSNYINQGFTVISTTLTGFRTTNQVHGLIGLLAQADRAAGDVCSFSTIIPLANSVSLNKNTLNYSTSPFGAVVELATNWDSLSPITSIEFFSSSGNIAATSYISIYGLR